MSSMYNEFKLPYMRLWNHAQKKIAQHRDEYQNLDGRTLPSVVRQDESIRLPSLTKSSDWLAYLLALYLFLREGDYQVGTVINHILRMARRNHYEGSWRIWFDLAEFFDLEVLEGRKNLYNEQRSRSSSGPNDQKRILSITERSLARPIDREAVIFSYMNFVEFLLLHFSEDDLFGNLLKKALHFGKIIKLVNFEAYQRLLERRRVRRLIRHRGYRDKGTAPDLMRSARRDANRLPEQETEVLFDTLNSVVHWGSSE